MKQQQLFLTLLQAAFGWSHTWGCDSGPSKEEPMLLWVVREPISKYCSRPEIVGNFCQGLTSSSMHWGAGTCKLLLPSSPLMEKIWMAVFMNICWALSTAPEGGGNRALPRGQHCSRPFHHAARPLWSFSSPAAATRILLAQQFCLVFWHQKLHASEIKSGGIHEYREK